MITLIDYGAGNLGSVENMLKKIGVDFVTTSSPDVISQSVKIILPGVGAFGSAMKKIHQYGLVDVLTQKAKVDRVPVLGICLGMQLMTKSSQEGGHHDGLQWIQAETIRFKFEDPQIKVPHKGWSFVSKEKESKLVPDGEMKFYFDHSYHVNLSDPRGKLLVADYGMPFTAAFELDNLFGVQFHPEKSHRYGMSLLEHFASL